MVFCMTYQDRYQATSGYIPAAAGLFRTDTPYTLCRIGHYLMLLLKKVFQQLNAYFVAFLLHCIAVPQHSFLMVPTEYTKHSKYSLITKMATVCILCCYAYGRYYGNSSMATFRYRFKVCCRQILNRFGVIQAHVLSTFTF